VRCIRITQTDGTAWTRDLDRTRLDVGRENDNDVVLPHPHVSRRHCLLEYDGASVIVKDRGTANGTFLNNTPLSEPRLLQEGDKLYVGPFLLELVSLAPSMTASSEVQRPMGPIFRLAPGDAEGRRRVDRLQRWATEWDVDGRTRRLLLRGRLLAEAKRLAVGPIPLSPLAQLYVRRSRRQVALVRLAIVIVALVWIAGAGLALYATGVVGPAVEEEPVEVATSEVAASPLPPTAPEPARAPEAAPDWVEHEVIPAETLDDIARRYEVAVANVARWNGLNVDAPKIEVGQKLKIKAKVLPLPQQMIEFELDRKYDWKKLSERFGVEVDKLRAYNPDVGKLDVGTHVVVWINPKPYGKRTAMLDVPGFAIRGDAKSIGRPNDGRLSNGIQMPASELYKRRAPFIMWGSSHTIETLQTAIARFRQELDFDGEIVVADISRQGGGKFVPHKSHQAGRDVDIWMPTLKGVYKSHYLERDRKPRPNEIDWFATWGLVRALIDTGQVVHIFLEYELQAKLHHAAKTMGATDEELLKAMQYPRGNWSPGIVGHSAGHTGHIHVRFKCGPLDEGCGNDVDRTPE
jgi:LysM repeat protein